MSKYILLALFVVLVSACAPDPRTVAEAEATRLQAQQLAADQAQARAQQAQTYELNHAEAEAHKVQRVAAYNLFVGWSIRFAIFAVCFTLAGLGIGAGLGAGIGAAGIGRAVANAAMVRSNLIYMDKNTRQFPLIQYAGKGFLSLTDINTGDTRLLNTRIAADRQLIAAAGAVRLAGMVAYEARHHKSDPAGVALVGTQPAIVGAQETLPNGNVLQVGAYLGQELLTGGANE
jgi:hypothetical protein